MSTSFFSKHKKAVAGVSCVLAAALLAFAFFSPFHTEEEKPADPIRPVRTVTVSMQSGGEVVMQTGEVKPRHEADLSFQIGGKITKRLVETGTKVTAGDVLALLDDVDIKNELRIAQADLASAQATAKLKKEDAERAQRLLASSAIAKARVDEAWASSRSADAHLKAAEAALDNAMRKVTYTQIIAPESGVITGVGADSGEVVSAGQMVARLANGDERDAVFDISEKIINRHPQDIHVLVTLSSDPSVTVSGTVREVSPSADPVTRTYRVKVNLPDAPPEMGYGATVLGKAEIPMDNLVALPNSALTSENKSPAVYVVNMETKRLERVRVEVSVYADNQVFIKSGLSEGQRVVIAGVNKLRPDQQVLIEEAGK